MDDNFGSFLPLLPPPTIQSGQPAWTAEAEGMEEDYADIEADDVHRSSPYTDGETRMVMIKDGEKDCWAMLVSQEMVDHINFAKQQSRAIEKREPGVDEAATEVLAIEVSIEEAVDNLNRAEGQGNWQLQLEIDRLQLELRQAKDRRNMLQEDMESYQSGFECSKNTLQRMVEDALEEAELLDPPEPDFPSTPTAEGLDETAQYDPDSRSPKDDESIALTEAPNEEELLRQAACEDLDQSRRAQRNAQITFDGRKEHYEQELMRFERLTAEGKVDQTRSEFDIEHDIRYVQQLTRTLREADEWLIRAQLNCQALGIRTDPDISYSDYSDYTNLDGNGKDDSWIDQDISVKMHAKREDIDAWTHGIWESQNPDTPETYDPVSFDEWDAKPDDPMDSISVLDCDRWVAEIGRWQDYCTRLRDEDSRGALGEDRWAMDISGLYRRRSV